MDEPQDSADVAARFGLGRLFLLTHEAVVAADLRTETIALWNPAAERLFGYSEAEAVGMPLAHLVPPELSDAHHEGVHRFRSTGVGVLVGGAPVEVPALTKDGKRLVVALTLTETPQSDPHRYVVAIIRDVTAQKRAEEELLRANQTMRDFVTTASHELRSPLTAIIGFGDLLRERASQASDSDSMEYAEVVTRAGNQAARLVDNLLTLSTIQAGTIETRPEVIDLAALVDLVLESTALEPDIEVEPSAIVFADRDHVMRMVTNLLSNASKHGAPPVIISAAISGPVVEIRVRDHGPGVPEDFRPRLFERFAKSGSGQSTSLGLSIIRGLANANGGDAFYEPLPDGSVFGVRLPMAAR